MKRIDKVWGHEEIIVNDQEHGYCGKLLFLKRGFESSYHCHKIKDETFFIYRGEVLLKLDGETMRLKRGDVIHIPINLYHSFRGITDSVIIEFSTTDDPKDSYRKNKSHQVELRRAYDYDGVVTQRIPLQKGAPIISGRSFEERDQIRRVRNHPIYFNPKTYNEKNHKNSAEWKAEMIKRLEIEEFFEDDQRQVDIIKQLCPNCLVVKV